MTNRFVPVLVSVAALITMFTSMQSKAFAFEIAGVNPNALPEQIGQLNDSTPINELQIVSDEQMKKIPLSAFYQFPVEKSEFKGTSTHFSAYHPGADFRATINSDIKPVQAGTVVMISKERGGYGNHVLIEHANGIQTLYAHMGKVNVAVGDAVETTTVIGTVGMTGHTTGPHLHFEMRTGKGYVNPEKIFTGLNYTPAPAKSAIAGTTKSVAL